MLIIKTTGGSEKLAIDDIKAPSVLETLQAAVGGYLEVVHVDGGVLFVNEDGRSMQLPPNPGASALALQAIVGDAVFCDSRTYSLLPRA